MTELFDGDTVAQGGYHQMRNCSCTPTTPKGAYRDVTTRTADGVVHHYYHQSEIVTVDGDAYTLDSHGYRTSTTKERMSDYLPRGVKVVQRDYDWYVVVGRGEEAERYEFKDGMTVQDGEVTY